MADSLSKEERSKRMSLIRSKDTKPELTLRFALHAEGYRYCIHRSDLPGSPDLVFPSRGKVVFVHGCFWHAHPNCKVANLPKTRTAYWKDKFARNRERDEENESRLRQNGWDALVVWECEFKEKEQVLNRVKAFLGAPRQAK